MKRKKKPEVQFVICINNEGYSASLEVGKLYRVLPDDEAASHGYLRVVDESGEDYGYTTDRFFPIEVTPALEKVLLSALETQGPSPNKSLKLTSKPRV